MLTIGILAYNINSLYENLLNTIISLEEEIKNVSESEKVKVDFLRSASHELKTPLMSMHIMIENMLYDIGKYKNHYIYLEKCKDIVSELSKMVQEILDTSRLNSIENKNENIIYTPCKGTVVPITEVPDPVFSEKVLGDGFAVIPAEGKIYAPTDGEVTLVFDTLHAVGMTSSMGTEILIHIGLDTVTLGGEPFTAHVAVGDKVKKGDLLVEVDLDKIKAAGLNSITPVLISNTDTYDKISLQKEGDVLFDEAVLKIL